MLIEKIDGFNRVVINRMDHRLVLGLDPETDRVCLFERNCNEDYALWFFVLVNQDRSTDLGVSETNEQMINTSQYFKICNKLYADNRCLEYDNEGYVMLN